MLPSLLTIRTLLHAAVASVQDSASSAPDLQQTLLSLKGQLSELFARLLVAMQVTTFSTVYAHVSRWFVKLAKLAIEALDWLLLPRLAWKITVRHCLALLVLYFIKVAYKVALIPIIRAVYRFSRPFFINKEYLQQERLLQERMANAPDYTVWRKAASELDRLQGRYHWKESSQSLHYDWRRIRDDLKTFRELVDTHDCRGIMAFSRSRLLRNLVGINDRRLYTHLRAGTKRLIEEYISEVVRALQLVCITEHPLPAITAEDSDEKEGPMPMPVSTAEKLSFFNETRHCLLEGTLVATPTGPKAVQEVQKGDQLIGEAGRVLVASEDATLRVIHPAAASSSSGGPPKEQLLFRVNAGLDDYVVTGDHRITVTARKLQVAGTPFAPSGSTDYTAIRSTLWLVDGSGDLQVAELDMPIRCSGEKQLRAAAAGAEESADEYEPTGDDSFEQDQHTQYELAVGFGDASRAPSPTPHAPDIAAMAELADKFVGTVAQCQQAFEQRRGSLVAAVLAQRPGYWPIANFSTVDVQAAAVFRYRKALQLGTADAKMRAVWTSVPAPLSDGASSASPVSVSPAQALGSPQLLMGSPAEREAAKAQLLTREAAGGVAVHTESFMVLEDKQSFSWREYQPGEVTGGMTTGLMLHNPLVSTDNVALDAAGGLSVAFKNINDVLQSLQVSPATAGIVAFELNPIPSSTGGMKSQLREYDAVCAASLRFALKLKLNAIVAFGWFTKYRWLRDCIAGFGDQELRVVSVSAAQPFQGCIDGLQVVLQLGAWNETTNTMAWQEQRVLDVWFAPHPCQGHKLPYVTLAMAAATRLPSDAALKAAMVTMRRAAPALTIEQIDIKKAVNTYNIAVAADSERAKRFALAGGTITHNSFGRSALLLSGGATLGLYHIGVCKSLHASSLLPRVLSGSSVGSIICAMVGTRTDDELSELFSPESNVIKLNFFPPNGGSVRRKITRFFTQGVLMDIKILKRCVKANVPPLTFQEAYELSGRIINIVVSPASGSGNKDSLRLLNYLTAPNVLVWSASLASCAIPGIYAPVELLKKDEDGKLSPYMEGGAPIKWEDGSVQADLPMQRLSELFNINHFIVSQVNPHVAPWISSASSTHTLQQSFLAAPFSKLIDYLCAQLKSTALNFLHLNMIPVHPSVKYILDQKYLGDITLVPDVTLKDYTQLLVNPTAERLKDCVVQSERSTWRLIPTIRGACEIEFTLDECVRRMRGTLILEELSDAQKYTRNLSRVRSWSSDLLAVGQQQQQQQQQQQHQQQQQQLTHARASDEDEQETRDEVLTSGQSGASRGQAASGGVGPPMIRSTSERNVESHAQDRKQWRSKFEKQPPRAHTAMALPHRRAAYAHDHQPEEDDVVSEEEEEARLAAVIDGAANPEDGHLLLSLANGRKEGETESAPIPIQIDASRCVDDEGIMREKPMLTPSTTNVGGTKTPMAGQSADNLVAMNEDDIKDDAQYPALAKDESEKALAANTTSATAAAAIAATGKAHLRLPSGKRVNLFSPDVSQSPPNEAWSAKGNNGPVTEGKEEQPPQPSPTTGDSSGALARAPSFSPKDPERSPEPTLASGTRSPRSLSHSEASSSSAFGRVTRFSSQRRRSAAEDGRVSKSGLHGHHHPAHSSASSSSQSRTPEPISPTEHDPTTLTKEQWDEEKQNARLSQLLKTSQTSVLPMVHRNHRASTQPADVSLRIPSLLTFRHTPPRRISTMDLQMMDQMDSDTDGAARSTPRASSHRFGTTKQQMVELNPSDYDSDLEEQSRPHQQRAVSEPDAEQLAAAAHADDAESGTIKKWMTRAASFFRGGSDSAVPMRTRTPSRSRSVSPTSDEEDATSPHVTGSSSGGVSFAHRSATHQQLSSLGTQSPPASVRHHAVHRLATHHSIPSATAASSASLPARGGASSTQTSPRLVAQRLRAHLLQGRFGGTDVQNPQPILRAATNGLPRTLSQLELVSDLSSLP